MTARDFPEMIRALPDADIPLKGVRGKVLQGEKHQTVFLDIDPIGAIPPHSHSAQWGIILEGEMVLTINGEAKTYRAGDCYFGPEGAPHSAEFKTHFRAVDFFNEPARYKVRKS
jgi:quercetin dioxygenase-like cupin family protein